MARPSSYTQELADEICAKLAEGISLRTICKADEMPSTQTVFRWIRLHAEFRDQYARAKEESADALVDEMLDIADDGSNDWMAVHNEDNVGYRENGEAIQRSRLRVDTRKWIAAKLKAKKYGDKIDHTHAAPGGGPIVTRVELVGLTSGNSTDPASA
jgi:hypothetical protein